ncbi:hypothetical protein BDA96_02G341200 [Sorghum bicolor]|jgi:hypothetical protein|uniref:Late embryogenesis abundant protein LEA-2 subgroup domain-containing protein n=2 Tax=Sorghum bicolor TaxID=4558 RepID=A0A921RRK0_SORBI|nr:NDR1/HIN1-like protein 2 [Sorghum bicolor]EER97325.1 hypothetical protein SORBI_3002G325200 [Sorghum bicolor]KAG0545198.1 hypothetical protein BDA96_02G341200 [Sorghum bicolor]|eukprot:XP_002460804.1 NDR1/HIN1-like protein 2 [Sorghum bicolor]
MRRYGQSLYQPQSPVARCVNFLCAVLLTLILIAGVILFVLWLSLRPHRPKFYLADFSIPNANRQSAGLANLPVHFTVNEHNPNQKIGMFYDEVLASVFYGDQLVATGPVMNPFYQVPKGDTPVQGTLLARGPVPTDPSWGLFAGEVAAGAVQMRLVLTSKVQFQVKVWDTKRHHMKVECDFTMQGDGTLRPQDKNSQCTLYF